MFCFVTVGTTQFNELVETVLNDSTLNVLHDILKVDELCVQFGTGRLPSNLDVVEKKKGGEKCYVSNRKGIKIHLVRFVNDFTECIRRADIVIGHAGAGTCLEVLQFRKPFIVVVNEGLADNHQTELAERLAVDMHLLLTTPSELANALLKPALFSLEPFPEADPNLFADYLDNFMGIPKN